MLTDEDYNDFCRCANIEEVKCWLSKFQNMYDEMDMLGATLRFSCHSNKLHIAQWVLSKYPNLDISACEDTFKMVCCMGNLIMAQLLLCEKPDIDISAGHHEAFRMVCGLKNLPLAQWLQSLKPYLYVIIYDENGKIVNYNIRTKKQANWQRRKYLVWIASDKSAGKDNLLYRLPSDVSKMLIKYI